MVRTFPPVAAATITVPARGIRDSQRRTQAADAMNMLLREIGFTGSQSRTFVGYVTELDSGADDDTYAPRPYVSQSFRTLDNMLQFTRFRYAELLQATYAWSGTELEITFADEAGTPVVRAVSQPLSDGRASLAGLLSRRFIEDVSPWHQVLDVDDAVAAIVARVSPLAFEADMENDLEDPDGILAFAEALERAGVGSWAQFELRALGGLAAGWTGSAQELLTTANAVGINTRAA